MFIQQFFVKGIAHSSYLLGGKTHCAIIDPGRDIDMYLNAANEMDMTITHILETHLHADFVSGHLDLAEKTGAAVYVPKSALCEFEHVPVQEGDSINLDDLEITVLETPGHTPEHVSYVVRNKSRGEEPVCIFCGDTLFVGDVGRPDLFPGKSHELASKLYDSLFGKIMKLPDFVEVYPAHGSGSLCGKFIGAKRTSTVGYERLYNKVLLHTDRGDFESFLIEDMPEAPDHFSRCSDINRKGPTLINRLPVIEKLSVAQIKNALDNENSVVLDTRPFLAFGGAHIPGSWNIDIKSNFATFAGWLLPPDRDILLVAVDDHQANLAVKHLRNVGLDRINGVFTNGISEWTKAGNPINRIRQITIPEMRESMIHGNKVALIDVRAKEEYEKLHIDGSVNIPVHLLRTAHTKLDMTIPAITLCNSGQRSSMAASILRMNGFRNISNVAGGMTAYSELGYAMECPVCVAPHVSGFMG